MAFVQESCRPHSSCASLMSARQALLQGCLLLLPFLYLAWLFSCEVSGSPRVRLDRRGEGCCLGLASCLAAMVGLSYRLPSVGLTLVSSPFPLFALSPVPATQIRQVWQGTACPPRHCGAAQVQGLGPWVSVQLFCTRLHALPVWVMFRLCL